MSQRQYEGAVATLPRLGWPPDDTEESVLGTNLHQATITNLRLGLIAVASSSNPEGQPWPWHALSQTGIRGLRRWDGSPYTVLPDGFVYRQAIDERRATLDLASDGPPLLVAEVLSRDTYQSDLDLIHGKGFSYAAAGIQEYLLLDATGEFLDEQVQAWRLEAGAYVPWRPDSRRRWQSRVIPVAVAFEGARLVVYGRHGRRQLHESEVGPTVARFEERLSRRDAEIARRDAEIATLRQRLGQRGDEEST